jgi:hypothetical protein
LSQREGEGFVPRGEEGAFVIRERGGGGFEGESAFSSQGGGEAFITKERRRSCLFSRGEEALRGRG